MSFIFSKKQNNVLLKVIWEEPLCHPFLQRMDSPASFATSFAMPTADESNHSGAGTLHPHCSATFFLYVTLHCPIPPPSNLTLLVRDTHPHRENHPPSHGPTTPISIIGTHTLNFYCYYTVIHNQWTSCLN